MEIIKAERAKRSNDLMIREKLEIVIPIIESDFIYAALSGSDFKREKDNFCSLLGIKDNYGMILVLEFGDALIEGNLTNPVGISVKAQSFYPAIRESLKEELDCVVSPIMVNKIVCFLSSDSPQLGYDDRIELIEKARGLIRELTRQHEIQFKIGIGSVASIYKLEESYKEALSAIRNSKSRVAHVKDLSIGCEYEADYPIEIEKVLFEKITRGDIEGSKNEANLFYDWMVDNYSDHIMDIKLKVLEFVLFAEKKAFLSGGMTYYFLYRKDYLPTIIEMDNFEQLRKWFIDKVTQACKNIITKRDEQTSGLISKAATILMRIITRISP